MDKSDLGTIDVFQEIRFGEDELKAAVWKFAGSDTRIDTGDEHTRSRILDGNGLEKGWISFDTEVKPARIPDLVVIARLKINPVGGLRYFVLFIEQQTSEEYKRLGVGMIQEDYRLELIGQRSIV